MNITDYKIQTPDMVFAIEFALQAGQQAREAFMNGVQAEWKDNETPVTQTDLAISQAFIAQVTKHYPDYGIISEEQDNDAAPKHYTWMIDPVDGTGPFAMGAPLYTCCISLMQDGEPILGVIYDPTLDRLYYAQKGMGAYCNDRPIRARQADNLDRQFVHIDSLKTGNRWLLPLRQFLLEAGCTPLTFNAIQYGTALTCAGTTAGIVYSAACNWDAAAGYVIGREAGCVVTDLDGNNQRYDQPINGCIVGATPAVHAQLITLVADCRIKGANL